MKQGPVVAVIQARMGSERLPGKVLMDIAGKPMLARVVERAARARHVDRVVVATSDTREDDVLAQVCRENGWDHVRGSEHDVLGRYHEAAAATGAWAVVLITADCPLLDPEVVDELISLFMERQPAVSYATNFLPERTFPRGLDAEVIRRDALDQAHAEDTDPSWREHVTPYIHRQPDRFGAAYLSAPADHSAMRWTVDTAEDLELVRRIYDTMGPDDLDWRTVLGVVEANPEWLDLNRHVRQKSL